MNCQKQFIDKTEYMIIERIDESHAIKGCDMSIQLRKPKTEERCLEILAIDIEVFEVLWI